MPDTIGCGSRGARGLCGLERLKPNADLENRDHRCRDGILGKTGKEPVLC